MRGIRNTERGSMKKLKGIIEDISGPVLLIITLLAIWIPEFIRPAITLWVLFFAYHI